MDAAEAALFAVQIGARIAIPYHFWMFPNHGGAPESFEPFLAKLSSACKPILLRQGEHIIVTAQNN